jgi:hypothetical protein
MALWKKLWLLFAVIWVVVAALQAVTIVAFSDEVEHGRAIVPLVLCLLIPAALYGLGWLWERLRNK